MMTAKELGARLKGYGFPVVSTTETNEGEQTDGEVVITPQVHIQVMGREFGVVVDRDDGTFSFEPVRRSIGKLVADLRRVLVAS